MAVRKKASKNEMQQEVNRINDEAMSKPNDIPVSEDGVIYDEPLLAGYIAEDGIAHKTFAYREMDGADEEEINKPEIRNNAGKVMNTLCERCVIKIGSIEKKNVDRKTWGNIIRSLYIYDLEYIMFKIRELSKGKVITFKNECPHCKDIVVTEIDTDEFEIKPFNGDHHVSFELRRGVKDHRGVYHKNGSLRIMNGFDAEIILPQYRKNEAVAKTLLMSRLMEMEDDGEGFMLDNRMVRSMSVYDRDKIENIIQDCAFGVVMQTELLCPNCGETFTINVGSSDFI